MSLDRAAQSQMQPEHAADAAATSTTAPTASRFGPKGPVRTLCEEIGFPFDPRLERRDVFVAFVAALVEEVRGKRYIAEQLVRAGCPAPSEGSATVLALTDAMLADPSEATASAVHDACWRLNPEGAYPTDHLIDMLSSCASAIRFGLEEPWRSRHAAAAANHVWKQVYGVSRFDSATGAWEKDWARQKLVGALISLLPAQQAEAPATPLSQSEGEAP